MKPKLFAYSNNLPFSFVEKLIYEFDLIQLNISNINDKAFRNNNIIFIITNDFLLKILEDFLLQNNVFILLDLKEVNYKYKDCNHTTFFNGPIHVKNINRIAKNNFDKNKNYEDVKLRGDTIINQHTKQKCQLTDLEKKFFFELVSKNEISKDYFLEEIIEVNKTIETKTAESHLTRIRKKLKEINSKIKISSKSDKFFFEN